MTGSYISGWTHDDPRGRAHVDLGRCENCDNQVNHLILQIVEIHLPGKSPVEIQVCDQCSKVHEVQLYQAGPESFYSYMFENGIELCGWGKTEPEAISAIKERYAEIFWRDLIKIKII